MKTRWFNYRPICLVFLFLLLGSLFSFFMTKNWGISISLSIIVFILLFVLAIIKKKIKYFIIPLIAFLLGFSLYHGRILIFNNAANINPSVVSCRVCGIKGNDDRLLAVQADNCSFDGQKSNANIIVYIYDNYNEFEEIKIGSVIQLEPIKFYKVDLFNNETPNSKYFSENIKYIAVTNISKLNNIDTQNTLDEIIRAKVKDNLSKALSNENVEIVYSALFGEKASLPQEQYDIYKASGVAHLLAVSGLHVSIIVGILYGFLSLIKVKKKYRLLFLLPILLFYAYLCGFTVSVVRAIIMAIILMIANLVHKEYDIYNSLAIAGIVIFLINPLCVFDVGFLLSFLSIFGIATLFYIFYNAFKKLNWNEVMSSSVAMSLSVTIAISAVMIFFFKTINLISFVANIILLPLFSFAFSICFIFVVISLIIPYVVYILYPINYIFNFINIVAITLGGLAFSNLQTQSISFVAILLYFILLLINGRLSMLKWKYKLICSVPIFILFCLTFIVV